MLEDYGDAYRLYLLPDLSAGPAIDSDWRQLPKKALTCLGEIPVQRVKFDATKRRSIDSEICAEIWERCGKADS